MLRDLLILQIALNKETEKDRLHKLDYRPTSKITQIEIEIEGLDQLISTKLDPAEEN